MPEGGLRRGRRLATPRGQRAVLKATATAAHSQVTFRQSNFASMSGSLVERQQRGPNPVGEVAAVEAAPQMTLSRLMERRPIAVLTHCMATGLSMFLAGGIAGAMAKTATAPLDRVKIIMQVSTANQQTAAAQAAAKGGLIPAFIAIGKSEGIKGYWKGNLPQVIRVLPYSSAMLSSYEFYKKQFANKETGELPIPARLAAGACAACTATLVTYPLDIIRLRLSVDPGMTNMVQVAKAILKDEGPKAFFKGLPATCLSISPYSAINFCAFDLFKKSLPADMRDSPKGIAAASLMATVLASGSCYPLDTIRRQMQLKTTNYSSVIDAGMGIVNAGGVGALFKGFIPNAVKNMPNKSIQLTSFDLFKKTIAKSETALKEEQAILEKEVAAAATKKGGKKK